MPSSLLAHPVRRERAEETTHQIRDTMNTTEWNFDGRGINGGGEYRDRIATLTEHGHALKAGPIMAAAPELAEALRGLLKCPGLGFEELEPETRAAIQSAVAALKKAGVKL